MTKPLLFKTVLVTALLIFSPSIVWGAIAYPNIKSTEVSAQDTAIIELRFNTEGANINTIEGGLDIISSSGVFEVTDIILGGSELTLWPNKPSLNATDKSASITFTGGSPNGFNKADALIMKVAIQTTKSGTIQVQPKNIKAYLNDGQGSIVNANSKNISFVVMAPDKQPDNELAAIIATDNTPPPPFEIQLGQEPNTYDGKWFISFQATDAESGIDHYEVREGDLPAVRSGSTYVLQNQEYITQISVIAFDKAGNSRLVTYTPPSNNFWNKLFGKITVIISIVLLLLLVWYGYRLLKKTWYKKQNKVS